MWNNQARVLSRRQILVGGTALGASLATLRASAEDRDSATQHRRARWVAGVEAFSPAMATAEWRAYSEVERQRWQASEPRRSAIQEWAARELDPLLPAEHSLVYPFAGPDALHALLFFRRARRMLLVGLEPAGILPDPARSIPEGYFARLGAASADLHRLTFFRTQSMAEGLQHIGVIGTIVGTVVRLGGTITSASVISSSHARVEWTDGAGRPRRLDYVEADLANAGLKGSPLVSSMMHGEAPYVTFLKAAMYLLTEARFSTLRQNLLDDSSVIVQDDSGIPLRYFESSWMTRLYGRYEPPVASFEDKVQPDLQSAYKRHGAPSLPFGVGYHVDGRHSNLLIAWRGARP